MPRATTVLLQCPRSFRATPENIDRLRRFFASVQRPAGVRILWEPRGPWSSALVRELCRELDLVHVVDPLDGAQAEEEPCADLRVREALAREAGDLGLAWREVPAGVRASFAGGGAGRSQLAGGEGFDCPSRRTARERSGAAHARPCGGVAGAATPRTPVHCV